MSPPDDIERVEVEFRKDILLAMFAGLVDRASSPVSLGITLLIPPGVITGDLVSYAEYLQLLELEITRTIGPGEGTDLLNSLIAEGRRTMVADMREEDAHGQPIDLIAMEFLHLKNARVIDGQQLFPDAGALLRVRARDVSGFFFGRLALGQGGALAGQGTTG